MLLIGNKESCGLYMAPGGITYKEALESYSTGLDYEVKMSKFEATNKPAKPGSGSVGKYGIRSSNGNGVHELLECPVCTNLMYPPINQVCVCVCHCSTLSPTLALLLALTSTFV